MKARIKFAIREIRLRKGMLPVQLANLQEKPFVRPTPFEVYHPVQAAFLKSLYNPGQYFPI